MDLTCKNVTVNDLRGEYLLQYRPQEPGIYLLNIKYGDEQIAGWTQSDLYMQGRRSLWDRGGHVPQYL